MSANKTEDTWGKDNVGNKKCWLFATKYVKVASKLFYKIAYIMGL